MRVGPFVGVGGTDVISAELYTVIAEIVLPIRKGMYQEHCTNISIPASQNSMKKYFNIILLSQFGETKAFHFSKILIASIIFPICKLFDLSPF